MVPLNQSQSNYTPSRQCEPRRLSEPTVEITYNSLRQWKRLCPWHLWLFIQKLHLYDINDRFRLIIVNLFNVMFNVVFNIRRVISFDIEDDGWNISFYFTANVPILNDWTFFSVPFFFLKIKQKLQYVTLLDINSTATFYCILIKYYVY